jgi:peptide/nickel transport system substrate-binding protein
VFDARVRRASHYAIARQSIVDEIYAGRARVGYFWLSPIDPVFPTVDRAVTKYDFDPGRAAALLGEAGWTRGPDGMLRNAAGQPLTMPILNTPTEADAVEAAVIVDNWRAVGIAGEIHRLSPQEIRDNELRSKFPGVTYNRRNLTLDNMSWLSGNVSQPDNRWAGANRSGYVNPRLDDLWRRVLGSVDERERGDWLTQAVQTMMDDAMVVLTHITPNIMAYNRDLVGPSEPVIVETSRIWNIWEWRWKPASPS